MFRPASGDITKITRKPDKNGEEASHYNITQTWNIYINNKE